MVCLAGCAKLALPVSVTVNVKDEDWDLDIEIARFAKCIPVPCGFAIGGPCSTSILAGRASPVFALCDVTLTGEVTPGWTLAAVYCGRIICKKSNAIMSQNEFENSREAGGGSVHSFRPSWFYSKVPIFARNHNIVPRRMPLPCRSFEGLQIRRNNADFDQTLVGGKYARLSSGVGRVGGFKRRSNFGSVYISHLTLGNSGVHQSSRNQGPDHQEARPRGSHAPLHFWSARSTRGAGQGICPCCGPAMLRRRMLYVTRMLMA